MASTYKTPGVYVREIRKFPPSVASVATAIPAFIGHTQMAKEKETDDLLMKPTEINSLLEYEKYFGFPQTETENMRVTINEDSKDPGSTTVTADFIPGTQRSPHVMYYSMQAFFDNGGGKCYVVSVGGYGDIGGTISPDPLREGLDAIRKEDEITLIVFPESLRMSNPDYASLQNAALQQCVDLQDRFVVMDVPDTGDIDDDTDTFRNSNIGIGVDLLKYGAAYYPNLEMIFNYEVDESTITIVHNLDGGDNNGGFADMTMEELSSENNAFYNRAKTAVEAIPCLLPPSPAMVGIYANVDETRGVWKAPANVGVSSVQKPHVKISAKDQEDLNVDVNAGKSINAIRTFMGKGTLVWGARTLAGNDNEWRYISVRRFFNMAEESIKKATEQFVFEPNDANTWNRVRSMIENFLILQWRAGALAGATPEDAFYVSVGLNSTMTALDILEGRMIVEIGMAVVRPAEFIILKFSHKMQES